MRYDRSFFDGVNRTALASARIVLPFVFEHVHPASVVDVGCGEGAWLVVAAELGASHLLGVDGKWVSPEHLLIDPDDFVAHDLDDPDGLHVGASFDVALCLETAEHLIPDAGPGLVRLLCRLSDLVLFSAAIPLQGGDGHIHERWADYWAALFAEEGFGYSNRLRFQVWDKADVAIWYRQNLLVFYRPEALDGRLSLADWLNEPDVPLRLVHPDQFGAKLGVSFTR